MRRPHQVSTDRVGFGRGTDNEVPLPDIRVELNAAALYERDGRLFMERLGTSPLRINRNAVDVSVVKPGDEIQIGPYQIKIVDPPEGLDAAITVELLQPLGDAMARLTSGARLSLAQSAFSRRFVSWTGFLAVAVLFLAVPIAVYSAGLIPIWQRAATPPHDSVQAVALSWNAGEISNPHRFFAVQCTTCHRSAFRSVQDDSCLGCHGGVGGHLEQAASVGPFRDRLASERCTTCHEEHRGVRGTVIRDAALCTDCHSSMVQAAPQAGVPDVGGFPKGHPQFRATLVADASQGKLQRATLGAEPPPMDHPGLKFSHAAHLVPEGYPVLGYKPMVCADCHMREPGAAGFKPITYKGQCQACHGLKFDRADLPWAKATVPHGDDAAVVATVWNFYAGQALQGGVEDAAAPAIVRRVAGSPIDLSNTAQRQDMQSWVASKAESTLRTVVLDDKRGCGYCHYGTGADGKFDVTSSLPKTFGQPVPASLRLVQPVQLRTTFLPQARFDHDRHQAMACTDCHNARPSQSAGDVLIPGIENCTACHGSENATLRAGSTCVTCHVFHRDDFGPMRAQAASAH